MSLKACLKNSSAVLVCLIWSTPSTLAQLTYERAPIEYGRAQPSDRVAQLARAIDDGQVRLEYSDQQGWLPSLLEQLQISEQSQLLVFSKTSLQLHKISPRTPRALYFNDDVYVGWCQRGDLLEIAATDPQLGAVFYTLDQDPSAPARIIRDRGQCLTCHATSRTKGVPGYLVRSIYSDNNGRPRAGSRTYVSDHTSPFEKRFGGWYVSGHHGDMRHLGNAIARDRAEPESVDREAGANRKRLGALFDTSPYLTPESDLVALLVLGHQTQMHNLIARASMETRIAQHYDRGINKALDRPLDTVSPSTVRRIEAAGEDLVRYLLFADEAEFTSPVVGSSRFSEQFENCDQTKALPDSRGRSLRQLDLERRLLKYPCSYLIYSDAFDALPATVAQFVARRVLEILTASEPVRGYERLSVADRRAIYEILSETKPGFLPAPGESKVPSTEPTGVSSTDRRSPPDP